MAAKRLVRLHVAARVGQGRGRLPLRSPDRQNHAVIPAARRLLRVRPAPSDRPCAVRAGLTPSCAMPAANGRRAHLGTPPHWAGDPHAATPDGSAVPAGRSQSGPRLEAYSRSGRRHGAAPSRWAETRSVIVTAKNPRHGRFGDVPDMTPEEHKRRGDAADTLFRGLKRQIAEKLGGPPGRSRAGTGAATATIHYRPRQRPSTSRSAPSRRGSSASSATAAASRP